MRTLLFSCLWVTVAAADPREHDGFQFRVGVGTGYVTDDVSGVPVSTEISVGTTVAPHLVIGGGTFSMIIPSPSYSGVSSGANHISGTGPFAEYAIDRLRVQAAVLFSAGYLQNIPPTKDSPAAFGFAAEAGVGYPIPISDRWSIGPIARVVYYQLYADGQTLHLIVPSALVALTYH
jgi:hypothetical protein